MKFLFENPITLRSGLVLRGIGSDTTELIFDFNGAVEHCINISNAQSAEYVNVIAETQKGFGYIVPEFISSFNDADYADLRQENGSWDTQPIHWATDVVGQIVRIQEIRDDSIFLLSPLRLDFDTKLNLRIRPVSLISNAVNCWVRGIESSYSGGSHVFITLSDRAGECLIQNNVFRYLRHAMMVKAGANGNVFGYNYSLQPNRSEPEADLSGDISLHGHYAFANLFEGNIVQNIIIDHFWGPSGPNNTFFRNRAELYGIMFFEYEDEDDGLLETSHQNFLGNEVTNTTPDFGNYILTGTNHFEYANNIKGDFLPIGTSLLEKQSLYFSAVPEFWIDQDSWPSLGSPNTLGEGTIPAKERYEALGQITVCPVYFKEEIEEEFAFNKLKDLQIYPNPAYESLRIQFSISKPQLIIVTISNLIGKSVFRQEWQVEKVLDKQINLNSLEAGIYFLSFRLENDQVISRKIIRLTH